MNISSILVPTDFSPGADAALDWACELAQKMGASLELVHVYDPAPFVGPWGYGVAPAMMEDIRKAAQAKLEDVLASVRERGLSVDGRVVSGTPAYAIVEVADQLGVDLIAIGTRGLTGLKHVAVGSVAERTVRHANCPVTTVKADD